VIRPRQDVGVQGRAGGSFFKNSTARTVQLVMFTFELITLDLMRHDLKFVW
jgi:hypothetical protein